MTVRADGYVQDRASQLVAAHVGAGPAIASSTCARPPAARPPPWRRRAVPALVVAADLSPARRRASWPPTPPAWRRRRWLTVVADGTAPPWRPGSFDRVLVDAPCSGLGVLRRRPDARWRVQPGDVARLAELQRRLLAAAVPLVRPGGVLVYSVCTLTREETAGIDDWLARTAPELVPLPPPGAPVAAGRAGARCCSPGGRHRRHVRPGPADPGSRVTPMVRIAPSILSADFAALGAEIDRVRPETDWLHVDVMDGHFVPNLTIGPPVVAAIRRHTDAYLDCHLMMTNPGEYLDAFADAGANHCTRARRDRRHGGPDRCHARPRASASGWPSTPRRPFEACEPWLAQIDLLLVMSVHPGFGGQQFMPEAVPKVAQAAELARRHGLALTIEVDGGIDVETVGPHGPRPARTRSWPAAPSSATPTRWPRPGPSGGRRAPAVERPA